MLYSIRMIHVEEGGIERESQRKEDGKKWLSGGWGAGGWVEEEEEVIWQRKKRREREREQSSITRFRFFSLIARGSLLPLSKERIVAKMGQ